jgi:hypothetical protein
LWDGFSIRAAFELRASLLPARHGTTARKIWAKIVKIARWSTTHLSKTNSGRGRETERKAAGLMDAPKTL